MVAGPFAARSLNRPSRSPNAARTVVAAAAVSARTRPVNSCSSIVFSHRFGAVARVGCCREKRRDITLNAVFNAFEHRLVGRDGELAALRAALGDAGRRAG